MQKATTPGAIRYSEVSIVTTRVEKNLVLNNSFQCSTKILIIARVMPMAGVNQKTVAAGLLNPILSRSRTCVRLHRRPPRALALMTRIKPFNMKCVSVATIRRTPENIRNMTAMRRHEKDSKRNRKANRRTKMREDDLHIAVTRRSLVIVKVVK